MQTLCSLSHHLHFFSYPKNFPQFLWYFLTMNRPAGNTPSSKSPLVLRRSPLPATPPARKIRRTQRGGAASSSPSAPLKLVISSQLQLPSSSSCCSRSSGLLGPRLPGALQGGRQLWRGDGKAGLRPAARSSAERGAGTLLAEWKRGR